MLFLLQFRVLLTLSILSTALVIIYSSEFNCSNRCQKLIKVYYTCKVYTLDIKCHQIHSVLLYVRT